MTIAMMAKVEVFVNNMSSSVVLSVQRFSMSAQSLSLKRKGLSPSL